jgi:proline iminopeptidase
MYDVPRPSKEGFVRVLGYRLFYRSFGTPRKGTVLCLHGGPGATHDYLLPLADLAKEGYRVVFYDQLGCGKSEVPRDKQLFVPERYLEEVEAFRRRMRLGKLHVIGSSWGGMLAIAYALKYQKNMKSLTTVGGLHSVPMTTREMNRMKNELPKKVKAVMDKYEAAGDYDNPTYAEAVMVFYKKHLCRLEKWPKELTYSLEHVSKPVYYTMNGPNEFTIIGNIRYWDVTDKLVSIAIPTLVLTGEYDEVSPKVGRIIHRNIQGSKLIIFPGCSHTPFWEDRDAFMKAVSRFIASN